jgi:hypothetical protein
VFEAGKGIGMDKNDKGHHIGADEQRMEDERKKMG